MSGPDCLSTANPLSVGVLDVAEQFNAFSGYLALVDVPPQAATENLDTVVATYSLDRGAFASSSLRGEQTSSAPGIIAAGPSRFLLGSGEQRALILAGGSTISRMASDPALTNILREDGRARLSIVAQLVGNRAPPCCETCDCLAFVDHAPFEFQSAPFVANIDLCNGCLASPTSCPDGSAPIANPASCNLGQDVPAEVCP